MILCFTGTGNSQYVADCLADKLNDSVISMNDIIKYNKEKVFDSNKPYIIVSPIYAWRLPLIVEDFIKEATFNGCQEIYVVATMQSQTGKADKFCEKIIKERQMDFKGLEGVFMPNNYGKVDPPEKIQETITRARSQVEGIAERIKNHQSISKVDHTPFAGVASKLVNDVFYKFFISDHGFNVNDNCIGCSLCEKLCPVNNIEIVNHKPVWNGKCIGCYSCLHHCPKEAINIRKSTLKTGRYVCPKYVKEKEND